MFVVVYAKIIDGKKNGLELEGPYLGPEKTTMADAHAASQELVSSCKDIMLIKVYDLEFTSHSEALEKAKFSFNSTYEDMQAAAVVMDRPVYKRKKRLRIKQSDLEQIDLDLL